MDNIYHICLYIPNIRMWFHMVLLMCLDQSDKNFQGLVIGVHQKELFGRLCRNMCVEICCLILLG